MKLKHSTSHFLFVDDLDNHYEVIFEGVHNKLSCGVFRNDKLIGRRTFGCGHANKTQAKFAIMEIINKPK